MFWKTFSKINFFGRFEIIHDNFINNFIKIFFFVLGLYIVIFIWKWNSLPPQIPIFYSLPRGEETLGTNIQLFTFPVYSVIFFLINFLLASILYIKERPAAVILIISSIVAAFLLFITFIKIVFLIT